MPKSTKKKMGSTRAASAISEPVVAVVIFLNRPTAFSLLRARRGVCLYRAMPSRQAPRSAARINNRGDGNGDAKWYFHQVWVIEGQVGSGQVQGQERGHHASEVADGLAHALFPDDHDGGHDAIDENPQQKNRQQILWP